MQIPKERLSQAVLRAIALEFASREGTDYGHQTWEMDAKVEQILRQVERGEVVVMFDSVEESCNLLRREDAVRAQAHYEAQEAAKDRGGSEG